METKHNLSLLYDEREKIWTRVDNIGNAQARVEREAKELEDLWDITYDQALALDELIAKIEQAEK